jgi:hypothetical protein
MAFDTARLVARVDAPTSDGEDRFEVSYQGEHFAVRRSDLRLASRRFDG